MIADDPCVMRAPCKSCGCVIGKILTVNGQDTVRCAQCATFAYNAPKTETGRAVRSVSTVHAAIKPKRRAECLSRATGRCELCGAAGDLHVGHILSVDDGIKHGLTNDEINHLENLVALCAECNLGFGAISLPARLLAALIHRRAAA